MSFLAFRNESPLLFILFIITDLNSIFYFCKFSLLVDYLKMYMVANSPEDCYKLQEDLVRFSNWCVNNHLRINITWNPSQLALINRLNIIQFRFLRYLFYKFKMNCPTNFIALILGLHSHSSRHKFNDALFIFKILNGSVICPKTLKEIGGWLIPTFYTSSKTTFFEFFHSQCYSSNEPKSRMLRICNNLDNFDLLITLMNLCFDVYV